jgi:hypothetical protein
MSNRSISTFARNCEIYANSENYFKCEGRKELLNSVNRSNINHVIILNYGEEEEERFSTLLHVAICLGDKFMCQRLLATKEINLTLKDSHGEDVKEFVARLKQENSENRASDFFLEFMDGGAGEDLKDSVSGLFTKLKKLSSKIFKMI